MSRGSLMLRECCGRGKQEERGRCSSSSQQPPTHHQTPARTRPSEPGSGAACEAACLIVWPLCMLAHLVWTVFSTVVARAVIVCVCVCVRVVASEFQPLDGHASLLRDLCGNTGPSFLPCAPTAPTLQQVCNTCKLTRVHVHVVCVCRWRS